jgi:hypothetical protein
MRRSSVTAEDADDHKIFLGPRRLLRDARRLYGTAMTKSIVLGAGAGAGAALTADQLLHTHTTDALAVWWRINIVHAGNNPPFGLVG